MMAKKQKRSICLVLCFAMAFTLALMGCNGNDDENTSSKKSSGEAQASDTSSLDSSDSSAASGTDSGASGGTPRTSGNSVSSKRNASSQTNRSSGGGGTSGPKSEVDLKGRLIKIGSVYGEQYNLKIGQSSYSDLFRAKEKEIEQKFNCRIEIVRIPPEGCEKIIADAVKAKSEPYQLVECGTSTLRNLARIKALLDQKTLKSINLNDSRYIKAINDSFTFKGKVYASGFDNTASIIGVVFNKKILEKNKQPDIYKLYDQGNWTFDAFAQIAKATTSPFKADKTRDVWGVTGATNIIGLALTSNAGATVSRDANEKYHIDMAAQKGVDAMNWCRKLMFEDSVYDYTDTWNTAITRFGEGKATFFPFYAWVARDLSKTMLDDIGFVAFPKGPGQSAYINGLYAPKAFAIPRTVSKPEEVARVYYELSSVSSKLWDAFEDEYKGWGYDDKSFKIIKELAQKYSRTEFSVGPNYSAFSREMNDSVFTRNGDPATVMAKVKSKFQKATDDYYNEFS